jgi:DNA-directed RNA polymerase specialized sigma24 family protein
MKKNPEKVKEHYVDNKKFYVEMIRYRNEYDHAIENNLQKPKMSDYAGLAIYKIANRLANSPNFRNYTYRDEMIEDGIENAIAYAHNFNPEKYTNPFAYFTQIVYYAFLRRIAKEEKNLYIKYKSIEKFNLDNALSEEEFGETITQSESTLEKINSFIERYEGKHGLNK